MVLYRKNNHKKSFIDLPIFIGKMIKTKTLEKVDGSQIIFKA